MNLNNLINDWKSLVILSLWLCYYTMSDTPRGACNMVQIGCGETVAIFENRMSQGG